MTSEDARESGHGHMPYLQEVLECDFEKQAPRGSARSRHRTSMQAARMNFEPVYGNVDTPSIEMSHHSRYHNMIVYC